MTDLNYPTDEVHALCRALGEDPSKVRHINIEPWSITIETYTDMQDCNDNHLPSMHSYKCAPLVMKKRYPRSYSAPTV